DLYQGFKGTHYDDLRLSGKFSWVGRERGGAQSRDARDQVDEAKKALTHAWALRPEDPQTNHALGRFYLATKQWDQAESYLKKALQRGPKSADMLNDYGFLAYKQHRLSEAARYFDLAMEQDPKFPQPVFNAAWLHIEQKNLKAARELVDRYQALEPDSLWLKD